MQRCKFQTLKCVVIAAAFAGPACGSDGEATSGGTGTGTDGATETEGGTTEVDPTNNSTPTTTEEPSGGNSDSVGMTTSGTTGPEPTSDPSTSTDPSTTSTDPSTTSSSTGGAVCGDGFLDDGEFCDDGPNNGMYNSCLADCSGQGPFCGDGAMDGPEACDDGNQVDDDACTNACEAAACGDGIVQMGAGEVCDDGVNDGSYGGCMADCLALGPSCGDGNIDQGDETCDDQNGDSTDGCLGNCAVPASCAEILAFDPAAMDGVHALGVGGVNWQAHCDMTTDGGGWTLAAKLGNTDGWAYQNQRWTNNMTFNANMPDYDHTQAKLETWNQVPFTEVLLGMESPITMNNPPQAPVYVQFDQAANSLFELFSPDVYVPTTLTRATWLTYVPMNSLQPNCNREGFNNAPNGNAATRVRIGILGNNQNDCTSPDSALGFGFGGFTCQMQPPPEFVGNIDCLSNPVTKRAGFGWLYVR